MQITRIRLENVKRHADLVLEFAPGLTVVRGPNEAGKSTIQRAIEMVLFRKATSTAQELEGVRTWGEGRGDPSIELDFDADGKAGRLAKTFGGTHGTVSLELDGETTADPGRVEKMIAELTGLPSEKFFRSTAGVRHQELADLAKDEGTLRDRLQLSMSGADRGTWTAKRRLDEAVRRYRADGPKNPGPLRVIRTEIERVRTDLATGEQELARLEQDRAALAGAMARRDALDAQLAREQADLEAAEQAVGLVTREGEAQARYERYRKAADLRAEIAGLESSHPSQVALPALRGGVERLSDFEFHISELRAELGSQPDPSQYVALPPPPSWKPFAIAAIVLLAAGIAPIVLVGGIAGIAVAGVLALLAIVSAYRAFRLRQKATLVQLQNELHEAELARRLQGRSEKDDQLRRALRDRDALLASLGFADLRAAGAALTAETDHVARIDRATSELRGVLGDGAMDEDVVAQRDRAAAEAEQARHALAGMGDAGLDPAARRTRLAAAVRNTQAQRDTALSEEGQAQGRVDKNDIDAEQVAALAERLTTAQGELAALERRLRIYQATLDAINAAETATMKKAARFLEERMGPDVADLTDGRYRRIQVDETNLAFTVYSPEKDAWIDARELSQGTLDQLYLAARLGLVRQVTQDRRPPLIFDDPFVTFDDQRARRAIDLLKHLAVDFQVIYLTCSDRYDALADRVIDLPAPDARDLPEGESAGTPVGALATGPEAEPAPVPSGPVAAGEPS